MKFRGLDANCLEKIVVGFARVRRAVLGRLDLVEGKGKKERGVNWAIGSAIVCVCEERGVDDFVIFRKL